MKDKVKFTAGAIVVAFITLGGVFYNKLQSEVGLQSVLFSENIEALTQGEEFEYPTGCPFNTTCGVRESAGRTCKVKVITCQGGGSGCNSKKCPRHPA